MLRGHRWANEDGLKKNHGLAIWNKFLYITANNLLFAFFSILVSRQSTNDWWIDGSFWWTLRGWWDKSSEGWGKTYPSTTYIFYNIFWSNWQSRTAHPVEKYGATEWLSHFRSFKLELCIAYTYNLDEFCFALVLPHFIYVHGFHYGPTLLQVSSDPGGRSFGYSLGTTHPTLEAASNTVG